MMLSILRPRQLIGWLIVAFIVPVCVHAADQTWSGGSGGSNTAWFTIGNWVGGAFPGSQSATTNSDTATIGSTGTNPAIGINMNFTGNTLYLGAINFNGADRGIGDSSATAGTLQLNGATVNGVTNTILRNSGTGILTLQGIQAGTMSAALGNATNNVVNIESSGGITISSVIKNGAANANLTVNGTSTGILTLSGTAANTYSGTTTVNVGELDLSKTVGADAIAGSLVVGDTIGTANTAITKLTASNQIKDTSSVTVKSDGKFDLGANSDTVGTVSLQGGNITGTTGVLTGSSYDVQSGTASAILGGSTAALTKSTNGSATLSGANTYGGGTTISAGTLLVANGSGSSATGSGTVNVGASGTLGGTGYINAGANGITINGVLSPGALATAGSVGTINLATTGALTLTSTSTVMFDITSLANKDLIALTNTAVSLGGTLALNLPVSGIDYTQSYTILSGASTVNGSFGSVTGYDSTDYEAQFVFSGGNYDIVFSAVPEPSTWMAGALSLLALAFTQRRRMQRALKRVS